jgi:hypothetical protein
MRARAALAKRAKHLEVAIPVLARDEPVHVVVDSTGSKSMEKASGRCANTASASGAPGANSTLQ